MQRLHYFIKEWVWFITFLTYGFVWHLCPREFYRITLIQGNNMGLLQSRGIIWDLWMPYSQGNRRALMMPHSQSDMREHLRCPTRRVVCKHLKMCMPHLQGGMRAFRDVYTLLVGLYASIQRCVYLTHRAICKHLEMCMPYLQGCMQAFGGLCVPPLREAVYLSETLYGLQDIMSETLCGLCDLFCWRPYMVYI